MIITNYHLVYMITFIFGTYIIYKFMAVFFNKENTNKKIEILSYILYYILTVAINILIGIPIIMTVVNIVAFLGLSYNYKTNIRHRLSSITHIYMIMMGVELLTSFIIGFNRIEFNIFATNEYDSILGAILSRIIGFLALLLYSNYKYIKSGDRIPKSKWFFIFFIPVSSIYITLVVFNDSGIAFYNQVIIINILLFINFATFYLYDVISENFVNRMKQTVYEYQNKLYKEQFKIMKNSVEDMETLKHDLANHVKALSMLIDKNENRKALEHLSNISTIANLQDTIYSNTGSTVIDSIVNFKIKEAEKHCIQCNVKIKIPYNLMLSSYEMTIVLGNLLDNAIEANKKLTEEERYIDLKVRYDRGMLLIRLSNPYSYIMLKKSNVLLTTKQNKKNHGIGLNSVESIVKANHGVIDLYHNNNIFNVKILMYYNEFE